MEVNNDFSQKHSFDPFKTCDEEVINRLSDLLHEHEEYNIELSGFISEASLTNLNNGNDVITGQQSEIRTIPLFTLKKVDTKTDLIEQGGGSVGLFGQNSPAGNYKITAKVTHEELDALKMAGIIDLLAKGVSKCASDIHIRVSKRQGTRIWLRIDGDLTSQEDRIVDYGVKIYSTICQVVTSSSDEKSESDENKKVSITDDKKFSTELNGVHVLIIPSAADEVMMILRLLYCDDSTSSNSKKLQNQNSPSGNYNIPVKITSEELDALKRFHECAMDNEGYDVPKEMMIRLACIGLVRRVTANIYEHTDFGLSVLDERA